MAVILLEILTLLALLDAPPAPAPAHSSPNRWAEPTRGILAQRCGSCHLPNLPTSSKGALAVFDLTEEPWYGRLTHEQFDSLLRRTSAGWARSRMPIDRSWRASCGARAITTARPPIHDEAARPCLVARFSSARPDSSGARSSAARPGRRRSTRSASLVRRPPGRTRPVEGPRHRRGLRRLDASAEWLRVDLVFSALGTTIRKAGSQEEFRRVDFEIPYAIAALARAQGAGRFLLVSSIGADARSRIFYSRVKGELEDAVLKLGYPAVTIARPSVLIGPRKELRVGELLMKRAGFLLPAVWKPVEAGQVASALVRVGSRRDPGSSDPRQHRAAPGGFEVRVRHGGHGVRLGLVTHPDMVAALVARWSRPEGVFIVDVPEIANLQEFRLDSGKRAP